ncbi:MAG: GAF domain-containing sensor histidine kinase [Crocosphaera sp.]|nr:GAF domain-containing sensor histidine kinase [Crocosphaera sp.]
MFSGTASVPTPSQDFIALCQSQVMLLGKTLQADWSAVYLTSEEQGQPVNLIPVVIYPLRDTEDKPLDPQIQLREEASLSNLSKSLPTDLHRSSIISEDERINSQNYQIVLPLVYQEVVLGVLVTRREAYPWKPEELSQIDKIADTLAIARLLDQRQGWYEKQLQLQQLEKQKERDRLDDLFHQLRNPLTALKVFGKLLLKRLGSDDQSRSIVNNIVQEGEHLQELIQEFESYQKTMVDEADVITLNTESLGVDDHLSPCLPPSNSLDLTSVSVWDVLETVIISAESIAETKGIDLQVTKPENLDPVLGNKSALREVLSNLIDNSIKYTPVLGKVTIKLGLSKVIDDKKYQGILIEDTGSGIPTEDQEHIFERHYRGIQENTEISGSGLGLAIAKELMTQMGGLIELFSPILEHNRGTRFIIWLLNQ